MIAVIAVILALLGLFGTWPILPGHFWETITGHSYLAGIESELHSRIGAYSAPDGWILIILVAVLVAMMFMVTTPTLLRIRRFIIGGAWVFYFFELFAALNSNVPTKGFAGLIYTFFMLSIALGLAFTQWGSKNALVSSLQGKPTSEFAVATQTITQIIQSAAQSNKWRIEVRDNQDEAPKVKEITGSSILKIGRDPSWANFPVSRDKTYVSRRHATFTPQPNGVIVRFEDAKYSMLVNGKLHKPSERMFLENQLELNVELVAGWGPFFKIQVAPIQRSVFHPKTMASVSDQLLQRYKTTRTQIKAALFLILFSVFGMGNLSMMATTSVKALYQLKEQQLQQAKLKINKVQKNLEQKIAQLKGLQTQIENLQQQYLAAKKQLEETAGQNQVLKSRVDSLKQALEDVSQKMHTIDAETIHSLEAQLQTLQDYILGKSIYAGLVPIQKGTTKTSSLGTLWIGKIHNDYYLITADHVLYPEDHPEETEDNKDHSEEIVPLTNNILLWKKYREGRIDTANVTEEYYQVIGRDNFTRYPKLDIAIMKIDNPGEYREFALPVNPNIGEEVINHGDFVSWFGFPKGQYASGKIGFCTDLNDCCIICNTPSYHGASGGPLFKIDENGNIIVFAVISHISLGHQLTQQFSLLHDYMLR